MSNNLQQTTAQYITDIAAELAKLANQSGLSMVGYLLELASAEASDHARVFERDNNGA